MFSLTDQPIDLKSLSSTLTESKAGALVTFEGWVRDHNQGKPVSSLEYQVYEALALKEGEKILLEAKKKFNLHSVACTHRHGHLKIGEVAVWVGASASHRNDAFLAARFVIDEIKHRLPIWKKEHYLNESPEWVYCKDHSTHVRFEEGDYYQKQKSVVNQALLKTKKVLVVGAGGLGCPALTSLTTAGIGSITIADFDRVELSNLHRQPLYSISDVGESKAIIAQKKLMQLNPFIQIQALSVRIDADHARETLTGYDLVLDCTDTLETKFALHDACFFLGIPLVSASIYRFEGQIRTFDRESNVGCLRCLFEKTPGDEMIGNCNDFGVLGASVMALGALQAGEAIQFLSRGQNASLEQTLYFDLESLSVMKIKNLKKQGCLTCAGVPPKPEIEVEPLEMDVMELTTLPDHAVELIDIREQEDDFLENFTDSSKKIVIYCHRGIRSKRLVSQYRARGFKQFYSLAGGACSL